MGEGYRESYTLVNCKSDMASYSQSYRVGAVTVGERIGERLKLLNISQSELARRTGLAQPTINALVKRNKVGSKYLHRIAAELRTSPAYLTGETEDPDPGYEPTLDLSSEAREMVELIQHLSAKDRSAVLQIVRSLAVLDTERMALHSPRGAFSGEG